MDRREFLWASAALTSGTPLLVTGCGNVDDAPEPKNQYVQKNLVANTVSYGATYVFPEFVDAWGIATRPAGAGGHFWITAGGTSWQFVGDVKASSDTRLQSFFQDDLKVVTIPGADSLTTDESIGKTTGTVFSPPCEIQFAGLPVRPSEVIARHRSAKVLATAPERGAKKRSSSPSA